jgi:hypothetical protein
MQHAEERLQEALDNVNAFFAEDWPQYRSAVEDADLSIFEAYEPLQMEQ